MMKRRLLCFCLAVVMLCLHTQAVFATADGNASKKATGTVRASDLSDPIRERILDGDSGYYGSFAFLNGNNTIRTSVIRLLVSNSNPNAEAPAEGYQTPTMEEQDKDLAPWDEAGNVFKVEFKVPEGVVVEPSFKWLVVCAEGYADATYGVLPKPVGESEFLGWFTASEGGDMIEADSLTTAPPVRTLYAHWKQDDTVKFTDVQENSAFYAPIYWAVQNRITKGTSATQFSPTAQCTRKQIIIFLWRAATQPANDNANDFSAAMEWAYQNGILSKEDKNFDKEAPCTRMEAMTYLWKQCGQPGLSADEIGATLGAFRDVKADDAYASAVAWAVKNGITKGTSATTFSPDSTCTRGQIVTFLYRAYTDNLLALG